MTVPAHGARLPDGQRGSAGGAVAAAGLGALPPTCPAGAAETRGQETAQRPTRREAVPGSGPERLRSRGSSAPVPQAGRGIPFPPFVSERVLSNSRPAQKPAAEGSAGGPDLSRPLTSQTSATCVQAGGEAELLSLAPNAGSVLESGACRPVLPRRDGTGRGGTGLAAAFLAARGRGRRELPAWRLRAAWRLLRALQGPEKQRTETQRSTR